MRNFHRWLSTAAMLLLAWVAVTGVMLTLDSMYPPSGLDGNDGPGGASAPTDVFTYDAAGPTLTGSDIEGQIATAVRAAFAANADTTPTSLDVQLTVQEGQPRTTVKFASNAAQIESPPAAAVKTPWYNDTQVRVRLHDLIQDLHRGNIIGISGQVMDILTGLSFVILSITGAVIYFQMLGRRRKSGNNKWFWH